MSRHSKPKGAKPLSLNERNERLLADFSQSCSSNQDTDPLPRVKKSVKVKIQGRRRLCKQMSSEATDDEEKRAEESNGPTDSPQTGDIFSDLSAKLDALSIEKKAYPKTPMSCFSLLSDSDSAASSRSSKPSLRQKCLDSSGSIAEVKESEPAFLPVASDYEDDCTILSAKEVGKEAPLAGDDAAWADDEEDSDFEDRNTIVLKGRSSTYTLPGKISKMLYPHQRDGLNWLWALHCKRVGGILGDDMGLGKTMQISAFLAGLFHSGLMKRALIVAPKTLLAHWIKELTAVGLSEKIREYYGTSIKAREYELQYVLQDMGILLTTYDIVRNNSKSLSGDYYLQDEDSEDRLTWDYIILDEGHIIKNPSTQRAKSLLEIPSIHRIIISGTPIQNNLRELWALFNFCCPNLLGDKQDFRERYEHPILRGNDKNSSEREKRIGSTVAKELRERIQPYFLRRLKSEVFLESEETKDAKLSKKFEVIVWLRLTTCQRQLYEAFLQSELVQSSFNGSPLAAITVLKKICDHPLLLTKKAAEGVLEGLDTMLNHSELDMVEKMAMNIANMTFPEETDRALHDVSCKITFIVSLLENLVDAGHSVLIFSQTRKMLNLVQEAITSKGYAFLRIDGTTKASERQKIVNDFQEGKGASIFLLTSKVGGLGLTLTRADRVIVVDPAWNPSTDNQSVDRAYRIGQNKDVLVYRLMTSGTIEEKIYRLQVFKGGLFKTATEHREQTRYFSQRDLQELFSLPRQGFDISLTQQQMHEEHDYQHSMDDSLKSHIKFLESQGIAGVSHHSLLFSKTKPLQLVQEDKTEIRQVGLTRVGATSSSSIERQGDWSKYAFNPKDKQQWIIDAESVLTDAKAEEIRKKIERINQTLANKSLVSKLSDQGKKLQKHMVELKFELDKIKSPNEEKEIIDLDDISGKFDRLRTG